MQVSITGARPYTRGAGSYTPKLLIHVCSHMHVRTLHTWLVLLFTDLALGIHTSNWISSYHGTKSCGKVLTRWSDLELGVSRFL